MIYPVDNFKTEWNGTAGYGFGQSVSYGFHDGVDLNDNNGGNSDLGKPLYAVAKGTVVGVHEHTGSGNFGKHVFIQIDGPWGTRFVHYAHCLEISVQPGQVVEEGQQIAKVGNSGTVYAHCHFAVKKKASGMDDVANTKAELDDIWEDPIAFIEKYLTSATSKITIDSKLYEELVRDATLWKDEHPKTVWLLQENERVNREKDVIIQQKNDEINALKVTIGEKDVRLIYLEQSLIECQTNASTGPTEPPVTPPFVNYDEFRGYINEIYKVTYDRWNIIPGTKYWYGKQLHRIKYIFENNNLKQKLGL